MNGLLYFTADDGVHGRELWRTDGTDVGTMMINDLTPAGLTGPSGLEAAGDALYFSANDGIHGRELWRLGPPMPAAAINEASLSGPVIGVTGSLYVFTATVLPLTATLPITFEWQATGHAPITHVVMEYSDSLTLSWSSARAKEISVEVTNAAGTVMAMRSMLAVDGAIVDLLPGIATRLEIFEDGVSTTVEIPPDAVSEPLVLAYHSSIEAAGNDDLLFAGRAFDLTVYRDGAAIPDFQFDAPLAMTISYRQQDVSEIDEAALKLYISQSGGWADAAGTCATIQEQAVDTGANSVAVANCRIGSFALFGPRDIRYVFLPVFWH